MTRVAPLSGFPEWAPGHRVIERHLIDELRKEFELHGFAEIETRAVEALDRLTGDSEAAKEIYTLKRIGAAAGDADSGLGLHFDLTVPFARYVEEFSSELSFPFRRYQIQKVWRGERPQVGRFREFYQADIDIVGRDVLPAQAEAEVAIVMARALARLPLPPVRFHLNDRRLVEAFYRGVGIEDVAGALRSVDKLAKIGADGVAAELTGKGIPDVAARACLELAAIASPGGEFAPLVLALADAHGARTEALEAGVSSLADLIASVNAALPGSAVADLRIARGLDYYTGVVYEAFLEGHEDLGSICSGGRYDSLVSMGSASLPGVGMSVGVSRLMSRIVSAGLAEASRAVPTAVLVALVDEDGRAHSDAIATTLRARGIPTEVAPEASKFGKQIQYADRRGIPFVWFPAEGGAGGGGEVKDIRSGEQVLADASTWAPPEADLWPRVERR